MISTRSIMTSVASLGFLFTVQTADSQTTEERRSAINDPVVGIIGAGINGQMTQLLWDISRALSEEGELRVLPILGGGSLQNIEDLLYLRGVDGAMIQSDVLAFYERLGVEENLRSKLEYVAALGTQMAHIVARTSIKDVYELEGKKVNFGRVTSGSAVSASNIFEDLGIKVLAQNLSHRKAIKALKSGDLDAMFWMSVPPIDLLQSIDIDEGLHFLEIPANTISTEAYTRGELTAEDYGLIPAAQSVPTVSVKTLLAVYNWPKNHPRYIRVRRFVQRFEESFDELRSDPYHSVFRTVNLDEPVTGGWHKFD